MTKEQLINLINQELTQREIGDRLGKSQASIRYWLNKHGLKTEARSRRSFKASTRPCKRGLER